MWDILQEKKERQRYLFKSIWYFTLIIYSLFGYLFFSGTIDLSRAAATEPVVRCVSR